jgi:Zn-dependent peptidase ImmA (M78 family)
VPSAPPHEGEHEARSARAFLGLGEAEPIADIVEAIEAKIGIPVFLAPLPGDVAGLAHRLDGRWYVVGDTAKSAAGRLRFTLAHELGHVWMNHTPSVDDATTLSQTGAGADPQEVEANYFAAEMLMPRRMVGDRYDARGGSADLDLVFELASLAGTTAWVALYRLYTCDLVPQAARDSLTSSLQAARRPVARVDDTVDRYARSGEVRKPDAHLDRVAALGELAPGTGQQRT